MAVNEFILIAILLGFVVSWVPRVLPFVLVKYKGLPDIVVRFLHYLPVSILFALILSSLTTEKIGHLPQFKSALCSNRWYNIYGPDSFRILANEKTWSCS